MKVKTCIAATAALVLSSVAASAQSKDVGVGVGVGLGQTGPAVSATQLESSLVPGVTFLAGPMVERRRQVGGQEVSGVGGFAGMLVNDGTLSGSAVSLDVQAVPAGSAAGGSTVFEFGADYSTPLTESWQFSARLSSSFAADSALGSTADGPGGLRGNFDTSSGESRFKDVGLGVGLDYNVTERWQLGTSVGYTRLIGEAGRRAVADEDAGVHQFFGGVVVNYRF